jgi:hypothetical protein
MARSCTRGSARAVGGSTEVFALDTGGDEFNTAFAVAGNVAELVRFDRRPTGSLATAAFAVLLCNDMRSYAQNTHTRKADDRVP